MHKLSAEDGNLLMDYIYLNIIASLLQKDYSNFEKAEFKLKSHYVRFIESRLFIIQNKLSQIKKRMIKEKIKVWMDKESSYVDYVQYNYYWHNKAEGSRRFWREGMSAEVNKRVERLFEINKRNDY